MATPFNKYLLAHSNKSNNGLFLFIFNFRFFTKQGKIVFQLKHEKSEGFESSGQEAHALKI